MAAHENRETLRDQNGSKAVLPRFVTDVDTVTLVDVNGAIVDGRPVFEFTVSWNSPSTRALKIWDNIVTPRMSNTLPKELHEHERVIPCDGGCGAEYSGKDVVQFGSCDHNICKICLKSCAVLMFDGTPACPNKRCLGLSSRSVSNMSVCSSYTQIFIVNLRLLIFYMEKGHVSRKQGSFEINSTTPLSVIKEMIQSYVPDLDGSEVFYTTTRNFHRSNLVKIDVEEMDDRPLTELVDDEEDFTFVVGCPGTNIAK